MTGSSPTSGVWTLQTRQASAAELHQIDPGPDVGRDPSRQRTLTLCRPTQAAVVLGSTQPATDIDTETVRARGLEVVRRRSGGGAVFVDPEDSIWIEAWIPRSDPLWVDDVSSSMLWLGRAFVGALADHCEPGCHLDMIVTPYEAGQWGRSICFLSQAPGEVRGAKGKIVGISQRRDRNGARLQAIVYRRWDPARWGVFADPHLARAFADLQIECVDTDPDGLIASLAAHLGSTR